ncbi:MAG: hypothetical protein WA985_08715 [Erythrobacter sp.]
MNHKMVLLGVISMFALLSPTSPARSQSSEEAMEEAMRDLQETLDALSEDEDDYGSTATDMVDYIGDELPTRTGAIVSYQLADEYDGYTAKPGSNAIFIDMATGTRRTVVDEAGEMLFNIDIVYDDSATAYAVGYIARVGTAADYAAGVLDLVVGRFPDLTQVRVAESLRYVDAPTFILDNSVAIIAWPTQTEASYMVIDLSSMSVSRMDAIDLPEAGELPERKCDCRDD